MADKKISQLTGATTPLAGTEEAPIVQSSSTKKVSVANLTAGRDVAVKTLAANATLSAWAAPFDSLVELKDGVSMTSAYGVGFNPVNAYIGSGGWTYKNSSVATLYQNGAGTHEWSRAVSGTAGGAITWISQLKTDSSDNVIVSAGNLVQGTAAKGVNFTANTPAAGMTSQLLNWYEEGTWTPGSGVGSATSASGVYTRIGRQVTVIGTLTFPVQTDSNQATITSLPFAISSAGAGGVIKFTDYSTMFYLYGDGSAATISLYAIATGPTAVTYTQMSGIRVDFSMTYFV